MTPPIVIVYGDAGCVWCTKALDLLEELGVEYQYHSLSKSDSAKAFFLSEGHTTIPQTYDEAGELIGGYEQLKEYLDAVRRTA